MTPINRQTLVVIGGAAVMFGLAATLQRRRNDERDPEDELTIYLLDHFTGSDAALGVVTRLAHSHQGSPEGMLCARLLEEFEAERDVLRSILDQLGSSSFSLKRAAGRVAGSALRAVAGGDAGSLVLFRALESLMIGVQGKRCMWRALRGLELDLDIPGRLDLQGLEEQALSQWARIESVRQLRLPETFAARHSRSSPGVPDPRHSESPHQARTVGLRRH